MRELHLAFLGSGVPRSTRKPTYSREEVTWDGELKETMNLGIGHPFTICSFILIFLNYSLSENH